MKRRRTLMHRGYHRSWLARTILARQPLVIRLSRIQSLPQMLGFNEGVEIPGQGRFYPVPDFDRGPLDTLPLPESPAHAPLTEKMENEHTVTVVSSPPAENPARPEIESALANDVEREGTGVAYPVKERPEQPIVEDIQANDFAPEIPASEYKEDVQSDRVSEIPGAEIQEEPARAHAKPSRGRIEESPAGTGPARPLPMSSGFDQAGQNRKEARASQGKGSDRDKTGQEEQPVSDLFAPRGTDRSPQAWMARLMGTRDAESSHIPFSPAAADTGRRSEQAQIVSSVPVEDIQPVLPAGNERMMERPATVILPMQGHKENQVESQPSMAVKANDAIRSTTPLSQRARRFLRPLVGFDPASVKIYQDTLAERLTEAYQADAISAGNDVEVAANHLNDTPETLGLLAHELIHVARLREPHFIPPIARSGRTTPSGNEEALALRVEHRVSQAAQQQNDQGTLLQTGAAERDSAGGAVAGMTNPGFVSTAAPDTWGGLPAPWEPLPDWLVASTSTEESSISMPVISSQPSRAAPPAGRAESTMSLADGGGNRGTDEQFSRTPALVQRAGRERGEDVEEEQETQARSFPTEPAKAPEPDLDMLAQQVYTHLKRRLDVERRRGS